ncbi:TniQ family protein [Streptomyces sp. NPDC051569]|uniref:TniQ family protein n=1 Tax=Streptomyces sp. NPDC051569 TaxID=3365661 RepID=UPI0037A05AFA
MVWVWDVPGLFGPHRPLPLRVRHLARESTGSFVNRLAHANGLELQDFLERVGQGTRSTVKPHMTEMYVNRAGREYLSVLAGRPAEELRWALPSLGDRFLEPDDEAAVWRWRWSPKEGQVLRICDLCAARRGIREGAWFMWPDSWWLCVEHGRWTDDAGGENPPVIRLGAVPEVLSAHRQRLRLERRLGAGAGGLFADAFQVVAQWWMYMPEALVWIQRAWGVGLEAREMRGIPLVTYPEAVALARAMVVFEREGRRGVRDRQYWLEAEVKPLVDSWALEWDACRVPLLEWLTLHSAERAEARGKGARSGQLTLSVGHRRAAEQSGGVFQRSCLPWHLGSYVV